MSYFRFQFRTFVAPTIAVLFSALIIGSAYAQRDEQATNNQGRPPMTALAVTSAGDVITGSQAGIKVIAQAGNSSEPIATKLDNVSAIKLSPNEKTLAVVGGSPAVEGTIELWSWPGRKLIGKLKGHSDVVHDIAWLADNTTLISGSADRSLRVWNTKSLVCEKKLAGHSGPILAVAISPNQNWLCSGSVDQTIRVWDTSNWQLARTLNNHLGTIHDLAFKKASGDNPQETTLASASEDGTVRIWYPRIGRMVRIVRHRSPVYCLDFGDDGTLYSGAKDGKVRRLARDNQKIERAKDLSFGWIISLLVAEKRAPNGKVVPNDLRSEDPPTILVGSSNGFVNQLSIGD